MTVLMLDVYGVVYQSNGVNQALVGWVQEVRQGGVRVCLASNMPTTQAQHFLSDTSLNGQFDAFYSSGLIGHSKPDPRFYAHIAKTEKTMPFDIVFFDDTAQNVVGAKDCGWQGYLYDSVEQVKKVMAS